MFTLSSASLRCHPERSEGSAFLLAFAGAFTIHCEHMTEPQNAQLQTIPSTHIQPPRIALSPVSMECTLLQIVDLGSAGTPPSAFKGEFLHL